LLGGVHDSRRLAVAMASAARQKWSLSQEAFDGLLAALGPDRDAAAARYLDIHANLTRMFEWGGGPSPSEHADEKISPAARELLDGEEIRDVSTYCIGIGRMLVRELNRGSKVVALEKAPELRVLPVEPTDHDQREECLKRCLSQLSSEDRDFILRYYQGD